MAEISSRYDLNIYTITGEYVGKVVDVVLNIRMGTISKLQVKALEPENKNLNIVNVFINGLQGGSFENEMGHFQEGVLNVDFNKVRAIRDIILINPQDIQRAQANNPQNPINQNSQT